MRAQRFKGSRIRIKRPGVMNSLEANYAAHLEAMKKSGEILDYSYEAIKIKLADKTYYSPDFLVLAMDGTMELHEVKAFWKSKGKPHVEQTAAMKIKMAADLFPARFLMVWPEPTGWVSKEF